MKITRLGWAGLELEAAGEIAVIDLLHSTEPMRQFMGEPHTELPPMTRPGSATLALVTHLHEDHTDARGDRPARWAPTGGTHCARRQTTASSSKSPPNTRRRAAPDRARRPPPADRRGLGDGGGRPVPRDRGPSRRRLWRRAGTVDRRGRRARGSITLATRSFTARGGARRMRTGDIDYAFLPVNGPPRRPPPPPALIAAQRGDDAGRGRWPRHTFWVPARRSRSTTTPSTTRRSTPSSRTQRARSSGRPRRSMSLRGSSRRARSSAPGVAAQQSQ